MKTRINSKNLHALTWLKTIIMSCFVFFLASNTFAIEIMVSDTIDTTISAGNDTTICSGETTQLSATTDRNDYYWSPISHLSCDECLTPNVIGLTQTTTFTFTSVNGDGSLNTDEVTVFVNPKPTISVSGNMPMCEGTSIQLTASGANSYQWSPTQYLSCNTCYNPIASPSQSINYTVTGIDSNGCSNSVNVPITVYPKVIADAGSGAALCTGSTATLGGNPTAYGGKSPYSYTWSPTQDLSCANCANPTTTATQSANYNVAVTDANGCMDSDNTNIVVLPVTNEVINGDFESGYVPSKRGQISFAPDWFQATGTPDLFDERVNCAQSCTDLLAFDCVDIPCNHFGYQDVRNTGQLRYAGLYGAIGVDATLFLEEGGDVILDYMLKFKVEGMASKLKSPLDTNKTYEIVLYASLAERGELGSLLVAPFADLVIKLSEVSSLSVDSVTHHFYQPTDAEIIFASRITDDVNWTKLTYTFKPTRPYQHLIIESDFSKVGAHVFAELSNDSIDAHEIVNSGLWINSYAYIDDVSIVEVCSYPLPVADAGPDHYLCSNDSTIIGGNPTATDGTAPYTYSWSPTTGLDCSTCANPNAFPSSTTTYTVTVTDANGATDVSSTTVYISNPSFTITNQHDLCSNSTVFIGNENGASGGFEPYQYQWLPPVKLSCNDCPNPEASPSREDSLVYHVTVTDSIGCSISDSVLIITYSAPFIDSIQVVAPALCPGDSTLLNALVSGGNPDYMYSWSPDSTVSSPNQALTYVTPSSSTMYTVTVTDAKGCVQQDSVYSPVFAIYAGADSSVCRGDSIVLGGNPTAWDGAAPYTYEWESDADLTCDDCPNPKTAPATGHFYRYYLTVTDTNGCVLTDEVVLEINNNPTANADYGYATCDSAYVTLGGTTVASGGSEPYTYLWTPTNLFNPTSKAYTANPSVQLVDDTTFFTITVTDANGCTGQDTVTYYTHYCEPGCECGTPDCHPCGGGGTGGCSDNLKANAGGNIILCPNTCDTIGGPPKNCTGFTYNWSPATGLSCTNCANPNACPTVTTTYTLTVTRGGQSSKDIATVYVNGPDVDAGPDQVALCSDSTVQIGGNPTALGGTPSYTYAWTPSATLDDASASNPYASPTQTTTYTVVATDQNGCTDTDSITAVAYPLPMADAGNDTTICSNDTYVMGGIPSGGGGSGTLIYTWNPGDYLSNIHATNPTLTAPVLTSELTIVYQLLVYDTNYCEAHDEVVITISPNPTADAGSQYLIATCYNDSVLIGTPAQGNVTYLWTPSTGLACNTCAETMALPSASQTYILTATNTNGCTSTDSVRVEIYDKPIVNAGPDKALCYDDCATLGGTTSQANYTYAWTPSDGLSSASAAQPTICASDFDSSGVYTYTLTVTDGNGCVASDMVQVSITSQYDYVFNGDFDLGTTPDGRSQITKSDGWFEATGTPDLFDGATNSCTLGCPNSVLDLNCVGVPCNHFGYQNHDNNLGSNERYAGIWAALGISSDILDPFIINPNPNPYPLSAILDSIRNLDVKLFVEGIETQLIKPFIPGTTYHISFWVSKAEKGQVEELFITKEAGFVVKTSILPATHPLYNPVDAQIIYTGSTSDETNWQYVSFQFTPSQSFEHLIIESTIDMYDLFTSSGPILNPDDTASISDVNLDFIKHQYSVLAQSYMYVDGVHVKEVCPQDSVYVQAFIDESICQGSCTNISASGNGNSYSWSPTTGLQDPNSANTTACPDKTTTYTVTTIDRSGNEASDQITITVLDIPIADAGPDVALCNDQCETLQGNPSASGGTPPYTYQWSNGGNTASIQVCSSQPSIYWLIVTDANGCQSEPDTVEVSAGSINLITNDGFELGNQIPENRNELTKADDWFVAAGTPDLFDARTGSCALTGCGTSPIDINCVGLPCNHFGYQTHRTNNGQRYAGLYAAVGSKVNADIGVDGRLLTEAIEIELNTALIIGNTYTVSFYVNKAEKGEVDLFTYKSAQFKVKMSTNAAYSGGVVAGLLPYTPVPADLVYEGTVSDESNWIEVRFNVKATKAYQHLIIESAFDANIIMNAFHCENIGSTTGQSCLSNLSFSDLISIFNPSDPITVIVADILDFIATGSNDELSLQSYMYVDDVSISEACFTDTVVVADAGIDKSICNGLPVGIGGSPTASGGTAPYSYSWTKISPTGSPTYLNNNNIANPVALPPSTTTYRVTVIDANGFSDFDDVTVSVYTNLIADAGNDAGLCDSNCFILGANPTASGGSGSYSYSWSPSSYLNSTTIANPTACVPSGNSVTYTVTVTDNTSGCQTSDQITITHYSGSPTNMVYNGNFDTGTTPTERDQIDYAPNWERATGSPDLFDQDVNCGLTCTPTNNVDIPNNHFGTQTHRLNTTEKRYAGVWSFNFDRLETSPNGPGAFCLGIAPATCTLIEEITDLINGVTPISSHLVEGIETKLNAPMIIGDDYQVTAYATIADQGEISLFNSVMSFTAEVDLNVKFSETFASNPNYNAVDADVKNTTKITQNGTWQMIQFTFTATKPYEYIILEAGKLYNGDESYIYLDDVEVIALCDQAGSSKEALANKDATSDFNHILVYPNPASNEVNIQLTEQSETPIRVMLMDVSGKVIQEVTYEPTTMINISTFDLETGTYFISVLANDKQTVERLIISK